MPSWMISLNDEQCLAIMCRQSIPGQRVLLYFMISTLNKLALCIGKDETKAEKLRSILAQLEFQYQINTWQLKGVPFKDHLYVPEVHPVTGVGFCEREDDGHVFKVLLFLCSYAD